jgi:hypothetical protein
MLAAALLRRPGLLQATQRESGVEEGVHVVGEPFAHQGDVHAQRV